MTTMTALYRHYDQSGRLLYVGVSLCAFTRARQHARSAPWFHDVATIAVAWFETRSQAEAAEWQAIRNEHPLHNQTFNKKAPAPAETIVVMGEFAPIPSLPTVQVNRRKLAQIRRDKVESRGGQAGAAREAQEGARQHPPLGDGRSK